MENKKTLYAILGVVAVVVVSAAVYFGNSDGQKGALVMPAGRFARPAPRGIQMAPRPNNAQLPLMQVVPKMGEQNPKAVTPPSVRALPFLLNPPANRVQPASVDTMVARFEITAPSKISLTSLDMVCNNFSDQFRTRESFPYLRFNFATRSIILTKVCGETGTSTTASLNLGHPVELAAGSVTNLDISMKLTNGKGEPWSSTDYASFGLSSAGFRWTSDAGQSTGFVGGGVVTAPVLKNCQIDKKYSSTSCDYVYPIPSVRPYITRSDDSPSGPVLENGMSEQLLAKFTITAPDGVGDIATDQVILSSLFIRPASKGQYNKFFKVFKVLNLYPEEHDLDLSYANPSELSGNGLIIKSLKRGMPIATLGKGESKTFTIRSTPTEHMFEDFEIELELRTGTPPAMGVGLGDDSEQLYTQMWFARLAGKVNELLTYRWMEPRGTIIKFGPLQQAVPVLNEPPVAEEAMERP